MIREFTKEELQQYNGQNGRPAYVAVAGVVYDVSGKTAWVNGHHHGNVAGQDLTATITNVSPHGRRVLTDLPVVGKLNE